LNEHGFKVVVVTNQSGIARGYFTEERLAQIHQKMLDDLARKSASLDAVHYCPHHPDARCECRKPNTGLFHKATIALQIDLASSYVIGDKLLDVAAAKRINCKVVLVPSSEPEISLVRQGCFQQIGADLISPDFYTAAAWIVAQAGSLVKGDS